MKKELNQEVMFPTPRTSDAGGGRITTELTETGYRSYRKSSNQWFGAKLRDAVEMDKEKTSKLNPSWEEQLMNLPVGWTQLAGATDPHENRTERVMMAGNGVDPLTAKKAAIMLGEELGIFKDL